MVINEFEALESEYRGHKDRVNFAPFYKMYMDKIFQKLSELQTSKINGKNTVNNDEEKILLYLYTASLSRFNRLTLNYESNLIIDMETYLTLAQEGLKTFKENVKSSKVLAIIKTTQAAYNDQIQDKLKEAADFVKSVINPEMSRIQSKLHAKVANLLEEIEDLKNQVHVEGKQLERKREELRTQMILNGVFGGLKVLAALANFIPGVGTAVGAGIGVAAFAGETIASGVTSGGTQVNRVDLPSVVKSANFNISEQLNTWLQDFLVQLTATSDSLDENKFTRMSQKVLLIKNEAAAKLKEISERKKLAVSENSSEDISDVVSFISTKKTEVESILEEDLDSEEYLDQVGKIADFEKDTTKSQSQSIKNHLKLVTVQNLNRVLESGVELYSKLQNNQNHINEVSAAIGENKDKSKKLNQFQNKVQAIMGPMLCRMQEDLGKIGGSLQVQSVTGLDVTKWEVTQKLQDIKILMREQFTQGFKIEGVMARAFEKLEEAFTTLIKVYERIQQFQQESKLANYIAEINSAQFRNQRSSEPMLNEAMERMDTQIQANVILGQYQLILNSLKMWAFPFAEFYLADFQIPERAIQTAETSYSNTDHSVDTIRSLIETVSTKIDKIRAKVLDHKSTHKDIDNYIHTSKFVHSESTRPFYVWKNDEFGPLIRKLLAGKEVVLKADIGKAPQSYDAVKFNKIGLRLRQCQEGTQTGGRITPVKLKEELGHFHIKMTHMGNSYYKYGDQCFVIESKKIPLSFNFQEEVDGTPVTRNETYTKISKGNIVLSPFAMWKIKLKPADPDRGFSKLISLSHLFKCDLELTGEGSYVSEGLQNSLNLDNYYSNTVDATVTPPST